MATANQIIKMLSLGNQEAEVIKAYKSKEFEKNGVRTTCQRIADKNGWSMGTLKGIYAKMKKYGAFAMVDEPLVKSNNEGNNEVITSSTPQKATQTDEQTVKEMVEWWKGRSGVSINTLTYKDNKRHTMHLSTKLVKKAKASAKKQGKSLSQYMNDLLQDTL